MIMRRAWLVVSWALIVTGAHAAGSQDNWTTPAEA